LFKDMHSGVAGNKIYRAKEGIKWIDLYTDIFVVSKEILTGRMKFQQYINSLRGEKEFAVASWDDPLPFVAETMLISYLAATR